MSFQTRIIFFLVAIIALMAAAMGIYHAGYVKGDRLRSQVDQAAVDQQKAEASTQLAAETAKVLARERELADLVSKQELQDAQHQQTVAALQGRLHAAAGPSGRLRDPNIIAARCGPGGGSAPGASPGSADDRADDRTEAGGLLSAQLTEILQRLQREADDINDAYASCRPALMAQSAPPS